MVTATNWIKLVLNRCECRADCRDCSGAEHCGGGADPHYIWREPRTSSAGSGDYEVDCRTLVLWVLRVSWEWHPSTTCHSFAEAGLLRGPQILHVGGSLPILQVLRWYVQEMCYGIPDSENSGTLPCASGRRAPWSCQDSGESTTVRILLADPK